jgi:hypothetical protein
MFVGYIFKLSPFLRKITNKAINDIPATNELANVYQLNIGAVPMSINTHDPEPGYSGPNS